MPELAFDIVVIGSGAGGGAVAKELSRLCGAGRRIAVLEWGPKLREEEFTGNELDMASKLYFDAGGFLTRDRTMTLAFAKQYGGSTVVYTGTSLTLPKQMFERWSVPGLRHDDLLRRSQKYLEENNVHHLEPGDVNDNNRLFHAACQQLGYRVAQFPVNVKGCRGSGLCNLGCPNAAKQGTNRVQLPAAQRNGVTVVTNCRVDTIGHRSVCATVKNPAFGEPSAWAEGAYRIRAETVVVCAGAVNSPALLLRSGFGEKLPALGRYFTAHPALILVAEHGKPITNYYGHPKSYYCDEFAASKGFLLETCMYFPFVTAKNVAGFGAEHSALLRHLDRMQMILVLALDAALAGNRVLIDRQGEPVVDYTLSAAVLESLFESMKVSARIFFAGGALRVHAPAGRKFFVERAEQDRLDDLIVRDKMLPGRVSISSAHLMGGCRMGRDADHSVCDSWGRVHGTDWLYVADASLFPDSAGINPYVTIMALADRVAEGIEKRLMA